MVNKGFYLQEVKVPHTPGATPLSTLGDAVQIRFIFILLYSLNKHFNVI